MPEVDGKHFSILCISWCFRSVQIPLLCYLISQFRYFILVYLLFFFLSFLLWSFSRLSLLHKYVCWKNFDCLLLYSLNKSFFFFNLLFCNFPEYILFDFSGHPKCMLHFFLLLSFLFNLFIVQTKIWLHIATQQSFSFLLLKDIILWLILKTST